MKRKKHKCYLMDGDKAYNLGKKEERKRIKEIIADEIKYEKFAQEREILRNWTWEDELRLLIIKIKEKTEEKEHE